MLSGMRLSAGAASVEEPLWDGDVEVVQAAPVHASKFSRLLATEGLDDAHSDSDDGRAPDVAAAHEVRLNVRMTVSAEGHLAIVTSGD